MNSVLVHILKILSIIQFFSHGDQVLDWSKQKKVSTFRQTLFCIYFQSSIFMRNNLMTCVLNLDFYFFPPSIFSFSSAKASMSPKVDFSAAAGASTLGSSAFFFPPFFAAVEAAEVPADLASSL